MRNICGCRYFCDLVFSLLIELKNIPGQLPGVSAGAPRLFQGFALRSFLEILEPMDFAPEVRNFE